MGCVAGCEGSGVRGRGKAVERNGEVGRRTDVVGGEELLFGDLVYLSEEKEQTNGVYACCACAVRAEFSLPPPKKRKMGVLSLGGHCIVTGNCNC